MLRWATSPADPLFTFPVYPLFNWLANRPPATFAILHWIDVTPDSVVANDLKRLLAEPPPAVVWQWIPEPLLKLNEQYFRQGRPSEMRSMRDAVAKLLEREYVLMLEAGAGSPAFPPLELWLRRDRAAAQEGAVTPGAEPFQVAPNQPLPVEAHG